MGNKAKNKAELLEEIAVLKQKIQELERSDTERKRVEEALRESEELLNATGKMAKVGGWELDAKTLEVRWTAETYRIHEIPPNYKPDLDEAINYFHPEERTKLSDSINRALKHGEPYDIELRFITAKGKRLWTRTICIPQVVNGKTVKLKGTFQDITERKRAEEETRAREEQHRLFMENLPIGLYRNTPGPHGRFIMVNKALARLHGFDSVDEFLSQNVLDLYVDPEQRKKISAELVEQGFISDKEVRLKKKDGTPIWGSITARAVRDHEGKVMYFDGTVVDISDRKKMEEEIISLSIIDQLTGLHNRRGFLSLAEQQFKLSDRIGKGMMFLFADLDGLKWINDTLGHEEGDKALVEAAEVLRETFRNSDIIARLGGDEYAVLATNVADFNSEPIISRLQSRVDKRNSCNNRKYRLSISSGCSYYDPENPCSIDELMASADRLMYENKQRKKKLCLQIAPD
jgi:diguanylate cyclase (GGDEF)-like protein/PAS domain S-box-containing protein